MFAFSVLHRLDLLSDSSCDNIGLRKYLSSLRAKTSQNEISHFYQMLASEGEEAPRFGAESFPLPDGLGEIASPIEGSQISSERESCPPIISPRDGRMSPMGDLPLQKETAAPQLSLPLFNKFISNRKRKTMPESSP
jgi:hypothetical protein